MVSCLGIVGKTISQNQEPCGYGTTINQLEAKFPGYKKAMDQQYLNLINQSKIKLRLNSDDTVYTVRVVVHIIYNTASQNVSDSLVRSQIRVLNEAFRKRHADTGKTRSIFKTRSEDVGIQFVLATEDPNGNSTNGIIRKSTSITNFGSNANYNKQKSSAAGGSDAWDPTRYLNIWVCNMQASNFAVVLGYATPPYGHPSWPSNAWPTDDKLSGVVIHFSIFGFRNPLAVGSLFGNSTEGRTAVHEVGHYLGLRHIWGDDDQSFNNCSLDDYIEDTPLQGPRSNFNCNPGLNTCNSGSQDEPDMIENYMDYSAETCQNMFTKKQIDVMRSALVKYRYGIIQKLDYVPTAPTDSFKVYYSGAEDGINILRLKGNRNYKLTIEVTDLIGRVILTNYLLPKNSAILDTRKVGSGIYIVRIKNEAGKVLQSAKIPVYK